MVKRVDVNPVIGASVRSSRCFYQCGLNESFSLCSDSAVGDSTGNVLERVEKLAGSLCLRTLERDGSREEQLDRHGPDSVADIRVGEPSARPGRQLSSVHMPWQRHGARAERSGLLCLLSPQVFEGKIESSGCQPRDRRQMCDGLVHRDCMHRRLHKLRPREVQHFPR